MIREEDDDVRVFEAIETGRRLFSYNDKGESLGTAFHLVRNDSQFWISDNSISLTTVLDEFVEPSIASEALNLSRLRADYGYYKYSKNGDQL